VRTKYQHALNRDVLARLPASVCRMTSAFKSAQVHLHRNLTLKPAALGCYEEVGPGNGLLAELIR